MFDPLDHPGIPVDHQARHWRELDVEPIDDREADSYTRGRIGVMAAVEATAERFGRQFAARVQGGDARRSVSDLADATAERGRHVAAVQAPARSAAEEAIARVRAAFDMAGWAARNEPRPDRAAVYRQQVWQHLERLRRYAEFGERAHLPWAGQVADEVDGLRSSRITAPARTQTPSTSAAQPLSLLHEWMVRAAGRSAAGHPYESREGGWEALVVHESASCHLYYGFMTEEDDRRLRPIWELHLQMQLAHLHAASDLLRRYRDRDPQEVIGEGLAEPVSLRTDRPLARIREPDRPYRGRPARHRERTMDSRRPERGTDVLELLIAQHARMNWLGDRVARSTGDKARGVFGELVLLIAAHEIAEEQLIHPLFRRLRPDDRLADLLLDEEVQISEGLSDAVRAAGNGHLEDTIGALRDMVTAHSRHEEDDEFPQLRRSVPTQERREMGGAVRAAEAAAAEADPLDPARAVGQAADRVRDALAGFS